MIFIGADHAGYELKEKLKKSLQEIGLEFIDVGASSYDKNDDYPDFAKKVALEVHKNGENKGIVICGTGIGACITANKFRGIRAALVHDEESAKLSREHNDSNILCLSGKTDKIKADKVLKSWLETPFGQEERHIRRIKKIEGFENENK